MAPPLSGILRRFLDAVNGGRYDDALAYAHPDIVIDEPPSLPQGGIFRGIDAPVRVKRIIVEHWAQQMGELKLFEHPDLVISKREILWTSRATGKSTQCTAVEFFEFRDGRVARITVYLKDVALLLATLEP